MDVRATEKYISLLLPTAVFGVYLCTITPVVYLGDSGEFTAAAFSLGIPHNSGYPLYSLLGKIFCMIPLGNVGFRMNLMSSFFSAVTVFLVYDVIGWFTRNRWCSFTAALFLAFTPLFWSQTVSAEVYPLHCFFVVLMIRLLWQWEKNRDFQCLLMFVFVTGLSFGNHMQTVMMAPAVLFFIISGDKKAIFSVKHFAAISIVFIIPLSLYLYLPIRTRAGVPIHWGDPDNVERFLAHVTATAHRGAYVFSAGPSQYLSRFLDTLKVLGFQYGILSLLAIWGWVKASSLRWRIFFAGIILFDFFYTIFLNVISIEITPFTLPSTIVMTILLGMGLNHLLGWVRRQKRIGPKMRKAVAATFFIIPVVALLANFGICDQSSNYTAYEHAVNIFRTTDYGSTIFLDGDNNVFPVAYGRMVEGMGDGISLFDRHNVIFKWRLETYPFTFTGSRNELESEVINRIASARSDEDVYFAVFNPYALPVPSGHHILSCGILKKVLPETSKARASDDIWDYYSKESYHGHLNRDYMNREVTSHYFFRQGENLWLSGKRAEGMKFLNMASRIGYDDTSIHSDLGLFFVDQGLFENAREELSKALCYYKNLSGIQNNWGYYHHKKGEYEEAASSFRKAIKLEPNNHSYYNNLGFTLYKMDDQKEAKMVFKKSLLIKRDQPGIVKFLQEHGMPFENDEP
ncbi:MAG: DUF2723 domain-containing protein [Deltaproteobacteria bacterium]|nr:DUF2723 domain-containing protein [Deltaproteobacteria bacterium]